MAQYRYTIAHYSDGQLVRPEFFTDSLEEAQRIASMYEGCVRVYDEEGNVINPKDEKGDTIQGAVNITDMDSFSSEMKDLMEVESEIGYERINFEDLNLKTAKVKDLMKLEFLFN